MSYFKIFELNSMHDLYCCQIILADVFCGGRRCTSSSLRTEKSFLSFSFVRFSFNAFVKSTDKYNVILWWLISMTVGSVDATKGKYNIEKEKSHELHHFQIFHHFKKFIKINWLRFIKFLIVNVTNWKDKLKIRFNQKK